MSQEGTQNSVMVMLQKVKNALDKGETEGHLKSFWQNKSRSAISKTKDTHREKTH